jgi:serine/threonine protein kinase
MDAGPGETAPLAPGQVLDGKYRVGRELGSGAMGLVYEAYHLRLQKAVAIKVLRPELAAVEDVRDRFEAEARAAAASGHPNIVNVTDLGQTPDGALYFVMDRLRGETLGTRLERVGKLDVPSTTAIIREVLSGLEAAHALRLVHRDLKPDNIFLAKAPGGREIAKILDFGIAKALASVGRRNTGTQVGMTVGTPLYMAPEQAVADPDIDARADLYAVGVILYQMLAGRPPFEGNDAVSVLTAVLTGTPPALETLCPSASPELARLVHAAMSRDRDQRPSSAADLAARLDGATATATGRTSAAVSSAGAALDDPRFAALDSAVLLDLPSDPGTPAPAMASGSASGGGYPEPPQAHDPHGQEIELALARTAEPDPVAEEAGNEGGDEPFLPGRRRNPRASVGRIARWLIPVPLLAAAGLYFLPGLSLPTPSLPKLSLPKLDRLTGETDPASRPTALVSFDVTPRGSRLYLDGVPLASNPISLGTGEVHTVTAVAVGYDVGASKFLVNQAKTVRLKLERGHARR